MAATGWARSRSKRLHQAVQGGSPFVGDRRFHLDQPRGLAHRDLHVGRAENLNHGRLQLRPVDPQERQGQLAPSGCRQVSAQRQHLLARHGSFQEDGDRAVGGPAQRSTRSAESSTRETLSTSSFGGADNRY